MRHGFVWGGALCAALLSSTAVTAADPAPAQAESSAPLASQRPFAGKIGKTYKDSTPAYPEPVKAPANAPNILLVLTDDVGFAASSTFGVRPPSSPGRCCAPGRSGSRPCS